ncbi:hypothetical protein BUY75_02635 [Staphylococcus epidermidis]|uniref:HNH endonuclease n=1 Tax=Staphylococcus epidermidis TaxID=1282 RepID=UPI000D1C989F|nr:HNH endonuclease [Staphylococcus epidermidis]PTE46857.1 hypothetical protein BUY75_02635 [Staphylococcus epidermidis]
MNKLVKAKVFNENEINTMIKMFKEGFSFQKIGEAVSSTGKTAQKNLSKLGYERKRTVKQCDECGINFLPHKSNFRKQRFCSKKCGEKFEAKIYWQKRKYKKRRLKKCGECGIWHSTSYANCSKECAKRLATRKNRIYIDQRMNIAKANGHFDSDIDIYKLIERDGEQCYLCGDTVLFDVNYNDPKYPTIEHVLAIAKGGTHSWDNVKVACRDCNCRKRTKSVEEFKEIS